MVDGGTVINKMFEAEMNHEISDANPGLRSCNGSQDMYVSLYFPRLLLLGSFCFLVGGISSIALLLMNVNVDLKIQGDDEVSRSSGL